LTSLKNLLRGGHRPCESCDFKLSNLHKTWKYGKEIGEKPGKLSTKSGKTEKLHEKFFKKPHRKIEEIKN